jgi:hypothetical protein
LLVRRIHRLFPDQESFESDHEVLEKVKFLLIPDYTPAKEVLLCEDALAQKRENRISRLQKRIKVLR